MTWIVELVSRGAMMCGKRGVTHEYGSLHLDLSDRGMRLQQIVGIYIPMGNI
jgi:hypothetical protein